MIVKISNYGDENGKKFVEYDVSGLSQSQIDYLDENLDEDTLVENGFLRIRMYFEDELYPFQSEIAQLRLDDFIAREEIEMNVFLSGFLEDF